VILGSRVGVAPAVPLARYIARADLATDDDMADLLQVPVTQFGEQGDCAGVDPLEVVRRVSEPRPPVAARSPRRGLEQQASPGIGGDRGVVVEVRCEHLPPGLVLDQRECGELPQFDAPVEDQVGLDPAVSHERLTVQLWECRASGVSVHAQILPQPRFRRSPRLASQTKAI